MDGCIDHPTDHLKAENQAEHEIGAIRGSMRSRSGIGFPVSEREHWVHSLLMHRVKWPFVSVWSRWRQFFESFFFSCPQEHSPSERVCLQTADTNSAELWTRKPAKQRVSRKKALSNFSSFIFQLIFADSAQEIRHRQSKTLFCRNGTKLSFAASSVPERVADDDHF